MTLRYPRAREVSLARVKVPVGLGTPRFLRVGKGDHFIPLEDVMMNNLDLLFPGMEIVACEIFRVTRNANTEKNEEEADDLMAMIESELKERKFAPIVRLEIGTGMDPLHRGRLAAELELDEENDVFEVAGMLAMRDLFELARLDYPRLHDPSHHPIDHPQLQAPYNIFHTIRDAGAILLQHPYESFSTSVERFLREAADDPKVRCIKMTLYRTSSQSRIIDALLQAAQNGKQVAVVVELKARFDEATNIRLAELMEESGVHVTYGVVGLKTHCKVILVVRQDYDGLRRYVHIGTGNYHAETARIYSDVGMLTCDPTIGQDATELFNYLTTGYKARRSYSKLVPAPKLLKMALLMRIEREIAVTCGKGGGTHPVQDERPGGWRYRKGAVPCLHGRGQGLALRARHLPPAAGDSRPVGEHPRHQHCRPLPGARPHLLFQKRRRRGVFHLFRRRHEAQPGGAGGDPLPGGAARTDQGTPADIRYLRR